MKARTLGPRGLLRRSILATLAVCALAAGGTACADTLLSETNLVSGTQSMTQAFTVSGPGTVTVQLSNIAWPQPLTSLSFLATTATQVLSSWDASTSATESFNVLAPGTYFAHVTGTATGLLNLGLYSLNISFQSSTAVPVPGSAWLLAAGLVMSALYVGVLGSGRRDLTRCERSA